MRTMTRFALAGVLWLVAAPGLAQPTQRLSDVQREGLDEEARQLFEAGEVAYQNGHYERAYRYFAQAYELSGRPLILYNMGLSAELARLEQDALTAYRGYLEAVPDSELHGRVRTRIGVLEERVAEEGSSDPPPPSSDPTPYSVGGATPRASGDPLPGWILFGGGLAVALTGGVLLGVASADQARVEGAPRDSAWTDYEDSASRAGPLGITGAVLLGVGAAVATLGVVLAITSSGSDDELSLRVGPGGLTLAGRLP